MTRALALIVAVCMLAMQKGDAPLRVKAFVCEREGRDLCGKRQRQGFERVRVRLEVYFTPHPANREVIYGLRCAGEDAARAVSGPYGLDPRQALLFVEHPDVGAGECYGVAQLARVYRTENGEQRIERLNAQSELIRILSQD